MENPEQKKIISREFQLVSDEDLKTMLDLVSHKGYTLFTNIKKIHIEVCKNSLIHFLPTLAPQGNGNYTDNDHIIRGHNKGVIWSSEWDLELKEKILNEMEIRKEEAQNESTVDNSKTRS